MRLDRILFCLLPAALMAFLAGCQVDYSEKAADEARKYALEHLKGLDEEQRHFIRYTQPAIYSNLLFPRYVVPLENPERPKLVRFSKFTVAPHQDYMHHCFVWAPPGLRGKIVVIGDGERSLRLWYPYRVIIKDFLPLDKDFRDAVKTCVTHAMNNMLYLPQSELNRIRFSEPTVCYTRFPIVLFADGADKYLTPWELYYLANKEKEKDKMMTQISLIWPADKPDTSIVITGFSNYGTLHKWKIHKDHYVSDNDLAGNALNEEEIRKIDKFSSPQQLVFPEEPKVNRGNRGKETGSLFGGNLKF